MKKYVLPSVVLLILFSTVLNHLAAHPSSDRTKGEINEALKTWNDAAKSANVELCLSMFDNSDNVILVGSDKGEFCKGKNQIRTWLTAIFAHANFSWEMNRIDIDSDGKKAWVFVEGAMIVQWDNGHIVKTPYRFTGVLVKSSKAWKWRLFNGSIPRGE